MKNIATLTPDSSRALQITPDHQQHPGWSWLWDRLLGPIPTTNDQVHNTADTRDRSTNPVNVPP